MPQSGQAVEVLLTEVDLGDDSDYIAAAHGYVTTLSTSYNTNSQQVILNTPLVPPLPNPLTDPPYGETTSPPAGGVTSPSDGGVTSPPDAAPTGPPVFLRIWNGLLTFVPGTPIQLGDIAALQ